MQHYDSSESNSAPRGERIFNCIIGLLLLIYGLIGLFTAHLNLNSQRIRIAVLEGRPALLMAFAFVIGAIVLLTVAVDHCDKGNTEKHYRTFRWAATRLSWCLAAAALISHFTTALIH